MPADDWIAAIVRRAKRQLAMTETIGWPEGVLARALNLVGAPVDLHGHRFITTWTSAGPPHAADRPCEVNGFNWRCLGCGSYGRQGDTYNDPGYRDRRDAQADAQAHAERCRFLAAQ
ncbi:hypothetical protein [Streptosporangium jomthongense]|uniref:Uncharacterized protein n=1 Tax=Streptosporangium jomthongense TaxID=1193683 RepID=A0ABV8F271_9ACTN